ncbi:hypothetical protein Dsin_008484 [Dipteronia sinensis]|uniref:RRM domain-containing protein n=1 Tax=Dipteronia sinensis TaxID=43782 RepID=A0AAE0APX4_9ROSI|nr:hypothetical protein Dsin_008484 [Dipteronia sinensis]
MLRSEGRNDYIEKLFSIFIDNLNPKVESSCPWGIFKTHERVRDVFLSPNSKAMRSAFAFIRFETEEEACRVAKRVDVVKDSNGRDEERWVSENKNLVRVKWESNLKSEKWLSKCSIGGLRSFSNVERVNSRLAYMGFAFSRAYVGDKMILWRFDSEMDCVGFIRNRFFWADSFEWMKEGTSELVPRYPLSWIEVLRVPLGCWNESFFMKISGIYGEALMVDKNTSKRKRFDKGRVLVLASKRSHCPEYVEIMLDGKLFVVSLKLDEAPVELHWLESQLGLKKVESPPDSIGSPVKEKGGTWEFQKVRHNRKETLEVDNVFKVTKEKGKEQVLRIPKPKPPYYQSSTVKLIIENKRKDNSFNESEDNDSSSSQESDVGSGLWTGKGNNKGECSKRGAYSPNMRDGPEQDEN